MYLLYVDESGSIADVNQKHFVLAGVCMFERQSFWIANEMDKIAAKFDPAEPNSVELHGNPMFGGKKLWRKFPKEERHDAIKKCLEIFANSHPTNRVFASVINKGAVSPADPVEIVFEQLSSRFDHFLMRLHSEGDTQSGIILFDKTTYETTIQNLAKDFRTIGHKWAF